GRKYGQAAAEDRRGLSAEDNCLRGGIGVPEIRAFQQAVGDAFELRRASTTRLVAMKPWLRHGSSKAISAVVALFAVGGLGAAVTAGTLAVGTGCSSSSDGSSSGGTSSSSGGGTGDGGAEAGTGPDVVGKGMLCPTNAHETVGAKISLTVTWPSTLANAGCDDSSKPKCTGTINIWLLTHYDITGTAVTGTVSTCKNVTPPIPLSSVGTQSEGLDPAKGPAVVQIGFDDAVWQAIIANSMVK